jgi:two-component system, NarL family, nitrate/nitrite response regulator NarL
LRKLRIIVADNNAACLQKLVSLLATECDVVARAENPDSILALVRKHNPDLVVLDIRTASTTGTEIAAELAKYPGAPPVLICAVETGADIAEAAKVAGALSYVFSARLEPN